MPKIKTMRHFAEVITNNALARHPHAMAQADDFIKDKASFGSMWPDWCYLPMAATYSILTKGVDVDRAQTVLGYEGGTDELSVLTAALIWTRFKMVYRFDQSLSDELSEQVITGDMPIELLRRMPEPCVFIESQSSILGREHAGFFAWLENDTGESGGTGAELRLLYASPDGSVFPYPVMLRGTIDSSIESLSKSAMKRGGLSSFSIPKSISDSLRLSLSAALNKILYLCSEAPDVDGEVAWTPQDSRRMLGGKLPNRATKWDVGFRIGSALRKARAEYRESNDSYEDKEYSSPRPHIRRAHWHHYWAGSERTADRRLVLKWLPPIPVGTFDGADIPVVIRPVEKD